MARLLPITALTAALTLTTLSAPGCGPATSGSARVRQDPMAASWVPPVAVSHPPFRQETFHANWLDTRGTTYVYMDVLGDYRRTGSYIRLLLNEVNQQGLRIAPNSSPFCLFYDDPGSGRPVDELRARVGIELEQVQSAKAPLGVDALPPQTVAHACVSGPYPGSSRAYPALFSYMSSMNWTRSGPIQEIYHIAPTVEVDPGDLVCEILIPVQRAGR